MITTPSDTVPFSPSSLEIASFWVSAVGTGASTIIAGIAVWLTVKTARDAQQREARARREAWARDYSAWLDSGLMHMVSGGDSIPFDSAWVKSGDDLSARAKVANWEGATALMVDTREARTRIGELPNSDRARASRLATNLLKHRSYSWVEDPRIRSGSIVEWIDELPVVSELADVSATLIADTLDGLQAVIADLLGVQPKPKSNDNEEPSKADDGP